MNYYRILEVAPQATLDEIKQAYRRLARKYHPDIAGNSARRSFLHISEAYQVLSNPLRRKEYDLEIAAQPHTARSTATQAPTNSAVSSPSDFDADTYALLKQRVRSAYNRKSYAIAVKLADELALQFSGHPTANRWVTLTYHKRGQELLQYNQTKLARIYLEKALVAQSRDTELISAIRQDLEQCERSHQAR
ncbi:MAG: J domain-containing protein [Cyanobacteria bacterium J06642_2]